MNFRLRLKEKNSELGLLANSALPMSDEENRRLSSWCDKEIK